jgi:hypothetical protein
MAIMLIVFNHVSGYVKKIKRTEFLTSFAPWQKAPVDFQSLQ